MAEETRLTREGLVSCVRVPGGVRLEWVDGRVIWLDNAVTETVLAALHGPGTTVVEPKPVEFVPTLEQLGLSARTLNVLRARRPYHYHAPVRTLDELLQLTEQDVRLFGGAAPVVLEDVRTCLKKFGLKLKGD